MVSWVVVVTGGACVVCDVEVVVVEAGVFSDEQAENNAITAPAKNGMMNFLISIISARIAEPWSHIRSVRCYGVLACRTGMERPRRGGRARPSTVYHLKFRIKAFELDAGVGRGEAPVNGGGAIVAVVFPGGNLGPHQFDGGDSSIEALGVECAQFNLGEV